MDYDLNVENQMPINILFLMEDLCYGGTQKQTLELARRLDPDVFNVTILTLTGPTDLDDWATEHGTPPYHLGPSRKVSRLFPLQLGHALRGFKPDILVNCTALPNIWGRIWGRLLGVPVIIGTCRGGGAPMRQHEKIFRHFAHHIICNSRDLTARMEELGTPAARISFIPNGVDTAKYQPVARASSGSNILCVGRLAADKDHKTLLKAFAILAEKDESATLTLVGEGPEEKNLKELIKSFPAHVAKRIVFTGADSDPAKYYANARIFALSSIREGQPNVVLEAMASGMPIAATRVGGVPEIVENEKNGLLSTPGNAEELANNLLTLLKNPELCEEFGKSARETVEKNFSFNAMVNAHESLFKNLWENSQKKGFRNLFR